MKLVFNMKKLIIMSFIVLVAKAHAYDQVAEAFSPGGWNEDIAFRINAGCNGRCTPGRSNITVAFLVPNGWEMMPNNNTASGSGAGHATCNFNNYGIFEAGGQIVLSQGSNNTSQQYDYNTFVCEKGISVRRVSDSVGLTLSARRINDSGDITTVRVFVRNGGGVELKKWNLQQDWAAVADLSRQMAASVPSRITIHYNSKIDLSPGEMKPMFQVSEAYGNYTVNVNIVGDASGDLMLVNSSGSAGNNVCNGSLRNGDECKIRANSNISWYGQKQATANITLSII